MFSRKHYTQIKVPIMMHNFGERNCFLKLSEKVGDEVTPDPPVTDEQVGTVTMDYAGGQYTGQVQGGLPHGRGEFVFDGVVIYQGEYKNGLFDGRGVLFRQDASKAYEGEFKDGEPHGLGVHYDEAGNVFEGRWE